MDIVNDLINSPRERQIVNARTFEAPLAYVFKAWTDPEYLKKWWEPKGFTNTFHEFELKPGGKWKFTMHGPDQKDYLNESTFLAIESPDAIAFFHESPPQFHVVASFEGIGQNETEVTFRMVFDSEEACNKLKGFAQEKNEENFDRLETVLQEM